MLAGEMSAEAPQNLTAEYGGNGRQEKLAWGSCSPAWKFSEPLLLLLSMEAKSHRHD